MASFSETLGAVKNIVSIDGNIKQQFLPFVLNPSSAEPNPKSSFIYYPSIFSFKNIVNNQTAGKLNICPHSIRNLYDDIAYKSLFTNNTQHENFNINTLYDSIPSIQIREYIPDTKLDQAVTLMASILDSFTDILFNKQAKKTNGSGTKSGSSTGAKETKQTKKLDITTILKKVAKTGIHAIKFLVGSTEPDFFDAVGKDFYKKADNKLKIYNASGDIRRYVLTWPYTIWYLLQSSTTTNIYELPGITDDKLLYQSNNHGGWSQSAGFALTSVMGNNAKKGDGFIGQAMNHLLGNIAISFMPWWDPLKGTSTPYPDIKIKFNLYNDTAESAAINFVFINTLIPNAKWIQYNFFQHSSSIYEIKLEGYSHLYACSGDFNVKYNGILRDISKGWIEKYLRRYINTSAVDGIQFEKMIIDNKLIKIPDVYTVEMTFKSLLPDTFNNFLYNYASNNIIKDYNAGYGETYHNSVVVEGISNGIKEMGKELQRVWNEK